MNRFSALTVVSPQTDFEVTELSGANGTAPVYLGVGDAAQFSAFGTLNVGSDCEQADMPIIECFTNSNDAVGTVDGLGVFVAKAPGHTQISGAGYSGDPIDVYVLSADIVPDWNHDRQITSADKDQVTAPNPFRFWKNDDDDFGETSEEDSDVPGKGGLLDNANCDDDEVNGRSDLLDFFPVWLDLHDTLNLLPPSGTVQYKLKQANGAVRAVYTDLTTGTAGNFLTTEGNTYGPSFSQNSYEADTFEVSSSGVTLSSDFLDKIRNDASKGILLIEGKSTSTAPLVLEVWKDGTKVCETKMPLSISGVEAFYRWVNLRGVAGGGVDRATDTSEPANNPDAHCNGKQFIFVHGYSVSETAAKGWNAEIFKRLYQSGSRAMFTAVTWFGNEGQVPEWIPWWLGGGSTPDYYANVVNAFETSSNLAAIVTDLPGKKCIAGHSLGNILVSSAIKDNSLSVNAYFMLNAAVAREAYKSNALDTATMRHPDWQNYSNRLWASEWYQLFGSGDGRNALTWRDRFQNIAFAYNYYSSTEDVLANSDGSVPAYCAESRSRALGQVTNSVAGFGAWDLNTSTGYDSVMASIYFARLLVA